MKTIEVFTRGEFEEKWPGFASVHVRALRGFRVWPRSDGFGDMLEDLGDWKIEVRLPVELGMVADLIECLKAAQTYCAERP